MLQVLPVEKCNFPGSMRDEFFFISVSSFLVGGGGFVFKVRKWISSVPMGRTRQGERDRERERERGRACVTYQAYCLTVPNCRKYGTSLTKNNNCV